MKDTDSKTFMDKYIYTTIEMTAKERYSSGIKTGIADGKYEMLFAKNKEGSDYIAFLVEDDTSNVYYCNR